MKSKQKLSILKRMILNMKSKQKLSILKRMILNLGNLSSFRLLFPSIVQSFFFSLNCYILTCTGIR